MIIPHKFVAGTKAKAQEVNENFDAVNVELSSLAESVQNGSATIMANVNSQITNVEAQLSALKDLAYPIGSPKAVMDNTLNSDEIWLEGQEVSKSTYSKLFAVYGNTYGTPSNSNNFKLPDFRNRVMWGSTSFGYISAGLPKIELALRVDRGESQQYYSNAPLSGYGQDDNGGAVSTKSGESDEYMYNMTSATDANKAGDLILDENIYGKSTTVQPPAVKVRVKTRYK